MKFQLLLGMGMPLTRSGVVLKYSTAGLALISKFLF